MQEYIFLDPRSFDIISCPPPDAIKQFDYLTNRDYTRECYDAMLNSFRDYSFMYSFGCYMQWVFFSLSPYKTTENEAPILVDKNRWLFEPSQSHRIISGTGNISADVILSQFLQFPIIVKFGRHNASFTDILHEYVIGIYAINKLRLLVPNYMYTYAMYNDIKRGNVLALEYIDGENLETFMKALMMKSFDLNRMNCFLSVFIQILLALEIGQEVCLFTHFDLHAKNIMCRNAPVSNLEFLVLDDIYVLKDVTVIPTFIDYGHSAAYCKDVQKINRITSSSSTPPDISKMTKMELASYIIARDKTKARDIFTKNGNFKKDVKHDYLRHIAMTFSSQPAVASRRKIFSGNVGKAFANSYASEGMFPFYIPGADLFRLIYYLCYILMYTRDGENVVLKNFPRSSMGNRIKLFFEKILLDVYSIDLSQFRTMRDFQKINRLKCTESPRIYQSPLRILTFLNDARIKHDLLRRLGISEYPWTVFDKRLGIRLYTPSDESKRNIDRCFRQRYCSRMLASQEDGQKDLSFIYSMTWDTQSPGETPRILEYILSKYQRQPQQPLPSLLIENVPTIAGLLDDKYWKPFLKTMNIIMTHLRQGTAREAVPIAVYNYYQAHKDELHYYYRLHACWTGYTSYVNRFFKIPTTRIIKT